MDITQDGDGEETGGKVEHFFIEDTSCSEDEEIQLIQRKYLSDRKQATLLGRESSPPLLLAFPVTCGSVLHDSSPSPTSNSGLQEEDSDQHIEEWMILGGGEQEGDSSIHLNLSYLSSSSSNEDLNVKSVGDSWAVSEKDKGSAKQPPLSRYFVCGPSLTCHNCNRTGHLTKTCHIKKCPTCILCGIQGHMQRNCSTRPCPTCGLPSHGPRPCEKPPLWHQHCQRCGMTGHLSDTCPDTWRQYHLTIRLDIPLRPQRVHSLKQKKRPAHCYNCSKRGHYGFECSKRWMVSGMFPTLPYVCHYDTTEDVLRHRTRMQKRAKDLVSTGSRLLLEQQYEPTGESGEENQNVQRRNRRNKEARSCSGKRKTWPERRKQRQEVKRLRREAQARREGGLLVRSQAQSDDDTCNAPTPTQGHRHSTQLSQKRKIDEAGGRMNRKSRETVRWKKRGGMKHGDLYPYGDLDMGGKSLVSLKKRVRNRRR